MIPCMLYCGDELCNCTARFYYEELNNWLTLDKKEQEGKNPYDLYLARIRDMRLNEYPVAEAVK